MAGLNIVFIASEATPLAKTGGLADVVGSLPRALRRLGHQVTVILPFYRRHLAANGIRTTRTRKAIDMWADGAQLHCRLHRVTVDGLRFILVEQDALFDREGIYGPPGGAYEDNLLRFVLFNRVALEAAAQFPRAVDIIHCHDWQTGMVPLLLHTQYQHHSRIARAKTVFTIHNLAYQGVFTAEWMGRLGIPTHHFHPDGFEFHGHINCMKAGIVAADAVTTVSATYAEEILTPEYGCGLEGFLAQHAGKLSGIVNGLDTDAWNPATDDVIAARFRAGALAGRKKCKADLQRLAGFEEKPETPVLAMISRLAEQKGVDLLLACIPTWMKAGHQLAILGSGDPERERQLRQLAERYPEQMYFFSGFSEELARKIYAGSDIFLMPSRFEPCGLGQLIAMRYGAVPVVRTTGGLKDTVIDYPTRKSAATGFTFDEPTKTAFHAAVTRAVDVFRNKRVWSRIRNRALRCDSSWDASAARYAELYQRLLKP